jgi:hypothetical protein
LEHKSLGKPQHRLDAVYNKIANQLNINQNLGLKYKTDTELIAEAGYYAGFADRSQISADDILGDRVLFASNNFAAIERIVSKSEKRAIVEKILDDSGFEHLITVRFISSKETWTDH